MHYIVKVWHLTFYRKLKVL